LHVKKRNLSIQTSGTLQIDGEWAALVIEKRP